MGREVVVAALAALALTATVAAAQEARLPTVGPLQFGMSLAQIKAAVPAASWADTETTRHAGAVVAIRGEDALTIAETPFTLDASDLYGARKWTVSSALSVASAEACDARARAVFAALEPGLPTLTSRSVTVIPGARTTGPWNVQRLPGGAMVVTPGITTQGPSTTIGETIQLGAASTAYVDARDAKGRIVSSKDFAKRPPTSYELDATTSVRQVPYVRYTARFGGFRDPSACSIALSIVVEDTRPVEERAFDPAKLGAPLISYRHWRASRLGAIPAEGVAVPLDCNVSRATNDITVCIPDGPTPPGLERFSSAIERIYETATYDLGAVDKDDPLPVRIRFKGRIDPGDRRPIDFLDQPRTPLKDLRFRRVTTAYKWQDLYSTGLRAKGLQATITMTCQIQTDYTVVCGNIRAEDQDATVAAAFEPAVLEGMTWAYAAETAKDGASSVGRVFDYKLGFKLEP